MQKAGVGTASALSNFLDSWSAKIKDIAKLENSQRTLQSWNDTYRVQRELVKKLLVSEGISEEVIAKVNAIYSTRSVNKAVEMGSDLFNLEKSEILKFIKSAVRYTKLKAGETS
jgi:DNA repair ATPase RecN